MYNKQLDTFLKIAELGSFSKAAQALYITPSAVIQQINALERDLDVRLLDRTPRGAALTPAGELLAREGRQLIDLSDRIRRQLKALTLRDEVCVGTSLLQQCHFFYTLWARFTADPSRAHCHLRMELLPPASAQPDIVEGIHWGKRNPLDGMAFLPLFRVPLVCAVWKKHPLAGRELLRYEDMRGQTMITVTGAGFSQEIEQLNTNAQRNQITIFPVPEYNLSVFGLCAANGYLLQIPQCWKDLHSELVAIPCEWSYSLPYGFSYREGASPLTLDFISFVQEQLKTETFSFS